MGFFVFMTSAFLLPHLPRDRKTAGWAVSTADAIWPGGKAIFLTDDPSAAKAAFALAVTKSKWEPLLRPVWLIPCEYHDGWTWQKRGET